MSMSDTIFSLSQYLQSVCFRTRWGRLTAPLLIFFWPASVVDKPRAHSWRSAIPGPNLLFSSVFVQRSRGSREPTRSTTGTFGLCLRRTTVLRAPTSFCEWLLPAPTSIGWWKEFNAPIYYWDLYGCFLKWWYPQIIHFHRVFHYKPSILGAHPYFRNPPYDLCEYRSRRSWNIGSREFVIMMRNIDHGIS